MTEKEAAPSAAETALVLASVCLAAIAMPLTFTGPAVALPALGKAFHASPIALNWVTNAFMLAFGSSLMAAGALADAYGRKKVFLSGVAAFVATSTGLAFAPNILCFDLLRAAQGVAAAAGFSGGMAALAQQVDGVRRLRAFSFVGASFGAGLAFGPILSGAMIDAFGWPAIFVLVVALSLLAFALGGRVLRDSRDPGAAGLDWPGAASFTLALTLLTYGVLEAPERGWRDPFVLALLLAAILLLVAFAMIERRVGRPMLDLSLFRYPRFIGVQLLAAAPAYAYVVLLVLLPIRFIGVEGMREVDAGRMMIALSAPLLILPIVAGLLTRWLSPAILCGAGLIVSAGGLIALSRASTGAGPLVLLAPMATIGVGISLPWGLMDGLAVSVVPKERAGMATGIFATIRVAGEGVALALVSAVLSGLTAARLATLASADAGRAASAAQRLVTGDLAGAAAAFPAAADQATLVSSYDAAFSALLWLLAAVTVFTAIVVFLFLGRREAGEQTDAAPIAQTR